MTHRLDVARGRDIAARWTALAEQRLEYLTELFETGRWRRFHSELAFLENIREAKTAVETWRDLATREAATIPRLTSPGSAAPERHCRAAPNCAINSIGFRRGPWSFRPNRDRATR
jgi:uncharacterized repeat protein (TIGR03809 family)